jgi:hypothetical protein
MGPIRTHGLSFRLHVKEHGLYEMPVRFAVAFDKLPRQPRSWSVEAESIDVESSRKIIHLVEVPHRNMTLLELN